MYLEEEDTLRIVEVVVWGWKTKDFTRTLGYVKITTSGVNCVLKNLRGDNSRSRKGIKNGIGLCSFIK